MRGIILILIVFFTACSSPNRDKIVVPELHAGFYNEALDRINDKLKSDPENERLVDQKLFYCEQLDWPTTCITALDAYKQKHGMTNQLVEQYINYYERHQRYQRLLDVIDKWGVEYGLESKFSETYIDCLTRLGRKKTASIALREYLKTNQSKEAIEFASVQYVRMKDTVMAAYNLGKLHKIDKGNDLMWEYGNILIELGYSELGFSVMNNFVTHHPDNMEIQLSYARLLESAGKVKQARKIIKPFTERDTVAYMLYEWYKMDQMFDSASYVLQQVIAKDSSMRKPIWKLGRLYEDRGWFSSALSYFEYLTDMNPGDTLAAQRIDLIQRKIAYLQRLKFEENKIPVIELQPKTIKD